MDIKRAKEIAVFPETAHVTHGGMPVCIESVSFLEKTAFVHPVDQPKVRLKVEVSSLVERPTMT